MIRVGLVRAGDEDLLQLRVLGHGLLEDGDVGVGVFPECQEVFGGSGPLWATREKASALLQKLHELIRG